MEQTDGFWIARCLSGQRDAYRIIIERYELPLRAFIRTRAIHLDEQRLADVLQETFVRAYERLAELRKPDSLQSWLMGIADRVLREEWRDKQQQRDFVSRHAAEHVEPIVAAPASADDELMKTIATLPEPYQQILLLKYFSPEELSCAQIAERLEMPLGSVTKMLSRAYTMLREKLTPSDQTAGSPASRCDHAM